MLQGHAFHAFTQPDQRTGGAFMGSQFAGGMPPAIFLFLVGVTLSFLMDSRERKGEGAGRRVLTSLRRAGYLLGAALLFRSQLWLFGFPYTQWTDLLKVDILNAMGLAVGVMSIMAVFRTPERARLCAVLGLAIAAASPLVSQLDWSGVHPLVRAYLAPDFLSFGFFPWAGFVAFGMSAGSVLRLARPEQVERLMEWGALAGFALILGGHYFSSFAYSIYPKSDFWLDSPWLVLIKLGVVLLMLAFAFVWTKHVVRDKWSWVRQFGLTSLLVYWAHIELMYGRWLWFWRENLSPGQVIAVAAGFIALMLGLSVARTQWKNWRLLGFSLGWCLFRPPRRASGD